MKIATLNINSVNARINNICTWLKQNNPDILLLQEIKTEFNNFPFFDFQMLGYEAKVLGQKSYNGVAVLSRHPVEIVSENLPNFEDDSARYLECLVTINNAKYTVASLYLPNGNPPYNNPTDTSKFEYKLKWMDSFLQHAANLLHNRKDVILGGDFNVILTPQDVYNPEIFKGDALYRPEVQNRLKYLFRTGWYDTFRTLYPERSGYTFWDYNAGSFQNDLGLRIDYILSSPAMTDCLKSCAIDKAFRAGEKASDHTVLTAEFEDR
ncbi:MAG: exodeoxyribonuclease III [Alphaproteobacteria bacterium]|nr:exodeoxyribonuclease III [Alphaproteobacteria bacterium]